MLRIFPRAAIFQVRDAARFEVHHDNRRESLRPRFAECFNLAIDDSEVNQRRGPTVRKRAATSEDSYAGNPRRLVAPNAIEV